MKRSELKFDAQGLIPAIIQDQTTTNPVRLAVAPQNTGVQDNVVRGSVISLHVPVMASAVADAAYGPAMHTVAAQPHRSGARK